MSTTTASPHTNDNHPPRARGTWLFAIMATAAFLAVAGRLIQLQVMEHRELAIEAARQVYGTVHDRDKRGSITDSRGITLATSIPIKACALDPKVLLESSGAKPERLIATLTEMLSLAPSDVDRIVKGLEKRRAATADGGEASEQPIRFVWIKRRLDDNEWRALSEAVSQSKREASDAWSNRRRWLKLAGMRKVARDAEGEAFARTAADGWRKVALRAEGRFAGVFFPPEYKRVYPQGQLASHILGFGDIDGKGLEGVEKTCEALLQGIPVDRVVARDARSRALSTLVHDERSTEGMTVELTIDLVVQSIVEEELQRSIDKLKTEFPDVTGHAVVMDPFTGDILAIANYPTFDPNQPSEFDPRNRRNDVVAAVQEPGSTFKPLVLSASIEEGVADFSEEIECAAFRMDNGRVIKDIYPYGRMSLEMALMKSSNPAMVRVGLRLGPEKMREYILKYGFGERTGSLLPGEVRGRITSRDKWSLYTMGSVPMGYEISVTTLQMATAYSVIANGGMLPKPNIIRAVYDAGGAVALKVEPEMRWRVISEKTAEKMRAVLRKVVTDGTGRRANIEEYHLGGKTGTANMMAKKEELGPNEKPRYSKNRHTANFVALAPWDKPKAVICVSIRETGKFGGEAGSPVGAAIARRMMGYWGVPTENGQAISAEALPLAGYDAIPAPAEYTIGADDDENQLSEEVDPRLWEEWVEDDEALG